MKQIVSPRVLHLATPGFFLSDQEFKHTNSGRADLLDGLDARQRFPTAQNDRENPMIRSGIALAGANHAPQITNAVAEDKGHFPGRFAGGTQFLCQSRFQSFSSLTNSEWPSTKPMLIAPGKLSLGLNG